MQNGDQALPLCKDEQVRSGKQDPENSLGTYIQKEIYENIR